MGKRDGEARQHLVSFGLFFWLLIATSVDFGFWSFYDSMV